MGQVYGFSQSRRTAHIIVACALGESTTGLASGWCRFPSSTPYAHSAVWQVLRNRQIFDISHHFVSTLLSLHGHLDTLVDCEWLDHLGTVRAPFSCFSLYQRNFFHSNRLTCLRLICCSCRRPTSAHTAKRCVIKYVLFCSALRSDPVYPIAQALQEFCFTVKQSAATVTLE